MRIAVTGASGVIGRGVVLRLLSAGPRRRRPGPSSARKLAQRSDLRARRHSRRRRGAAGGRGRGGRRALRLGGQPGSGQPVDREVNIGGTANVLDAMAPQRYPPHRVRLVGARLRRRSRRRHAVIGSRPAATGFDARAGQGPRRRDDRGVRCRVGGDPRCGDPRPGCRQLGATSVGFGVLPRAGDSAVAPCRSCTATTRIGFSSARPSTRASAAGR